MNKEIICPACKHVMHDSASIESYNGYMLYRCLNSKCCLEFWWPLKMPGREFYENKNNFSYFVYHNALGDIGYHQQFFFENYCRHRQIKGLKVMDIGCGDGVFLKECKKIGFKPYGIDFDSNSVKVAKDAMKIENVFCLPLNELLDNQKNFKEDFDLVTFFEVLEHQDDPIKFIGCVKKLLKKGGCVAGTVPDGEMTDFVARDRELDMPPHHFIKWDKRSLFNFLRSTGFDQILVKNVYERRSIVYYIVFIEKKIFGDFFRRLKREILFRKKSFAEEKIAQLDIEKLERLNIIDKRRISMVKILKYIRNIFLYPLLAIPYYVFLPKKQVRENIYFQAMYTR